MIRKIFGKIMQWKNDSENLPVYKEMVRRYEILLNRIAEKCEETDYGLPEVKNRKIIELAKTDISKDSYDNGFSFWLDDEEDIIEENIDEVIEDEPIEYEDCFEIPKITRKK